MKKFEFILSEEIYHVIIDTLSAHAMNCLPDEADNIYKALQMMQVQVFHNYPPM